MIEIAINSQYVSGTYALVVDFIILYALTCASTRAIRARRATRIFRLGDSVPLANKDLPFAVLASPSEVTREAILALLPSLFMLVSVMGGFLINGGTRPLTREVTHAIPRIPSSPVDEIDTSANVTVESGILQYGQLAISNIAWARCVRSTGSTRSFYPATVPQWGESEAMSGNKLHRVLADAECVVPEKFEGAEPMIIEGKLLADEDTDCFLLTERLGMPGHLDYFEKKFGRNCGLVWHETKEVPDSIDKEPPKAIPRKHVVHCGEKELSGAAACLEGWCFWIEQKGAANRLKTFHNCEKDRGDSIRCRRQKPYVIPGKIREAIGERDSEAVVAAMRIISLGIEDRPDVAVMMTVSQVHTVTLKELLEPANITELPRTATIAVLTILTTIAAVILSAAAFETWNARVPRISRVNTCYTREEVLSGLLESAKPKDTSKWIRTAEIGDRWGLETEFPHVGVIDGNRKPSAKAFNEIKG